MIDAAASTWADGVTGASATLFLKRHQRAQACTSRHKLEAYESRPNTLADRVGLGPLLYSFNISDHLRMRADMIHGRRQVLVLYSCPQQIRHKTYVDGQKQLSMTGRSDANGQVQASRRTVRSPSVRD